MFFMQRSVRALAIAALLFAGGGAVAQPASDLYKGRNVDLYIGYSAGGGYDLYARALARFIGRHLPGNPTVTPRNMEGAGSLRLANWLYNLGPKDGLSFGTFARGTAFDPLFGSTQAQFDASKYNWIGSANNEVSTCVMWAAGGVTTMDDLLTKPSVMGGSGGAADTDQFVYVMNGVLGTKIKLVQGYPGGNEVNLAMERGEVQGRCGWSWSSLKTTHPEWLRDKKVTVPVQLSLTRHPEVPDTPVIMDYAKSDADRAILDRVPWQARDPNGKFNAASVLDIQDWFVSHKMLDGKQPIEKLISTEFSAAAEKELGPFKVENAASKLKGCR